MSDGLKKKIAVGSIEHETAGFLPGETSLDDFLKSKKKLGENLWPGKKKFFELILKFPKGDIYEKVKKSIDLENKKFDKKIEKIIS